MHTVAISVRGKVRNIGKQKLNEIFVKNPYMAEIYPKEESRSALEVFELYEGTGELFDLSCKPIYRQNFTMGNGKQEPHGYFISEKCKGCGACVAVCPQSCIEQWDGKYQIRQANCLHCGKCMEICSCDAVEKR